MTYLAFFRIRGLRQRLAALCLERLFLVLLLRLVGWLQSDWATQESLSTKFYSNFG